MINAFCNRARSPSSRKSAAASSPRLAASSDSPSPLKHPRHEVCARDVRLAATLRRQLKRPPGCNSARRPPCRTCRGPTQRVVSADRLGCRTAALGQIERGERSVQQPQGIVEKEIFLRQPLVDMGRASNLLALRWARGTQGSPRIREPTWRAALPTRLRIVSTGVAGTWWPSNFIAFS